MDRTATEITTECNRMDIRVPKRTEMTMVILVMQVAVHRVLIHLHHLPHR